MRKFILIFTSFLYYSLTSTAPQKQDKDKDKGKFPLPLPDLPPYDLATPAFVFDGIDYNELPEKFREPQFDCHGHWLRCINNRTYFSYACAYKLLTWESGFWGYYYSQCEIELQNCVNRLWYNHGVYGTDYTNDYIFYSGESWDCSKNFHKEDPKKKYN